MSGPPFRDKDAGVAIYVRLSPNASQNRLAGVIETGDGICRIKARVCARPEGGKANKALLKLLAKQLSLPISSLTFAAGHKDRNKTILASGDKRAIKQAIIAFMTQ